MLDLITKIFIINLKKSVERKKHFINEFKKVNIKEYEIFEAVDEDNIRIKDMFQNNFVKKFPPCFRCNNNICNCSNNILIKPQIGNWCSFIDIMNNIIINKYNGLIMICEDDIKFNINGKYILESMINEKNFELYNINLNKPLLIRCYGAKNNSLNENSFNENIRLTNQIEMSNPCFLINFEYAKSFINNLKQIDRTSDMYIHSQLCELDKSIQHYTIKPSPVYELSFYLNYAIFPSTIHPKGINEDDLIKMKNHKKQINYEEYIKYNINNLWHSSCNNNKNVGDIVGKYIFEKITNTTINYIHPSNTKDLVYLTCGSIIQDKHIMYNNTIIWGSGIMFDNISNFSADIKAVRGKKTKNILDKLNIPCPDIFGDIALLLPKFYNPDIDIIYDIGLIFHYSHVNYEISNNIINILNSNYKINIISVDLDVELFINEIKKCKYTLSSSLHGTIISHAYSIKSLPFHMEKDGLNNTFFKFEDYYSSFDIELEKYIFSGDIINCNDIINMINSYYQPLFPIKVDKLWDSCPFKPYYI
jgi:GR25 family glycosyltransferase involved in LPS biosynthesis